MDRKQVLLGEEFVLTITVQATGTEPVQIIDPLLSGLVLRGTSDRSQVSISAGVSTRVRTRELRLSANRTGKASIGAVRARMGNAVVSTDPIEISVTAAGLLRQDVLNPHIRALVESHVPDSLPQDEAYVEIVTSADSVVLGEQIDLIVIAWFPREIRSRLRNPPLLDPPQLAGAWTYPGGDAGAVALGRQVGATWYDLYVHHQAVFPLTPGNFEVGPAKVSYSLPLTFSFLSRERRHEVQSDSVYIMVSPQPTASRPAQFEGAAGVNLEFSVEITPTELSVGEAGMVVATVSGRGNVSLWPEPKIKWPGGLRVYPENVAVDLGPGEGKITGTKRFHYLIVADSAGVQRVPQPLYEYFDLGISDYVSLRSTRLEILIRESTASRGRSGGLAALMQTSMRVDSARLTESLSMWSWLLLLILPPLAVYGMRMLPRITIRRSAAVLREVNAFERTSLEFKLALENIVSGAQRHDRDHLADALRAAGVEEHVAMHTAGVRDRVWQVRYGPSGELDPEELVAEMEEVLKALIVMSPESRIPRSVHFTILLLSISIVTLSHAQSAERLYETGALRAAADSFLERTEAEPWSAAHQYNLGLVMNRSGFKSEAKAAWVRAARLEPRNREIRKALRSSLAHDVVSRDLTWVSPLTPAESLLAAALLWVLGWILVGFRVRRRAILLLVLATATAAYGEYIRRLYLQPIALIVPPTASLREAPYGPAATRGSLERSSAVRVLRVEGFWVLVEHGRDQGWLIRSELTRI